MLLYLLFSISLKSSYHFSSLIHTILRKMKEALVSIGPKVNIVDSDIPKAGKDQVVIKVVFSGSNPKDWKIPGMFAQVCHLNRRPSN